MSCQSNQSINEYNSCTSILSHVSSTSDTFDDESCTKFNYQDPNDSQYSFISTLSSIPDSCSSCYNSPDDLEYITYSSPIIPNSTSSIYPINESLKKNGSKTNINFEENSTETLCYDSEATQKMNKKRGLCSSIEKFACNELSLSVKRLPLFLQQIFKNKKMEVIEITDQIDLKLPNCYYYSTKFFIDNDNDVSSFIKDFYQTQKIEEKL